MRLLPGLSLVLLLVAGCSSHGSTTTAPTPSNPPRSTGTSGEPTVAGRSVRIDLTEAPARVLHGRPGGGVAVVVTVGPDPDHGGYQADYDLGAP